MQIPDNTIQFLHSFFDKIFVVSVPRFVERQKNITEKLTGLHINFFWGQDKLTININQAILDGLYNEDQAKKLQRQNKPLNVGELACAISHKMVYEEIIKHNWKKVLVLEDDILPLYSNLSYLPQTFNELPNNWELVYLGYLKHEKVTTRLTLKAFFYITIASLGLMKWNRKMVNNFLPKPYSAHLKKAGFHDCTHAYAITYDAARKLLEEQSPIVYRADDLLSHTIMKGKLNAYVCDPKFFDQEGFYAAGSYSTIKED